MEKTLMKIAHIFLIVSFLIIAISNYWLFFDTPNPIVFEHPNNMSVDKETYHLGDYIMITEAGCRYTDVPEKVCWKLIDGINYDMGCFEITGGAKDKCWQTGKGIMLKLPEDGIHEGRYKLYIKSIFKINPITERIVETNTKYFYIYK